MSCENPYVSNWTIDLKNKIDIDFENWNWTSIWLNWIEFCVDFIYNWIGINKNLTITANWDFLTLKTRDLNIYLSRKKNLNLIRIGNQLRNPKKNIKNTKFVKIRRSEIVLMML